MWALKTLRTIVTTELGTGLNIKGLLSAASYSSPAHTPCPVSPISLPHPASPSCQVINLAPPTVHSLGGSTESLESSLNSVQRTTEARNVPEMPLVSLLKGLPEALLRQYEYEDPLVRGGKHLMHSQFFKVWFLFS